MSPKDVAGVFSRYFIVGFFLPAYFVLVGLSRSLTSDFLPTVYKSHSEGTQLLILGGAALLLGLLLLGLNYPIYRLFEGYPLFERSDRWYVSWLIGPMRDRERQRFHDLCAIRDSESQPQDKRGRAAWRLDREFPPTEESVLPTRFGNAVRAFEVHATTRWGLDSVGAWPRIELLMSDSEAENHATAKSDVAFFINGALLAAVAGLTLVANEIASTPLDRLAVALYLIPFALSYLLYRFGVGAAVRWGSVVRAIIDLHRFAFYEAIGVRQPKHFTDEREVVAPAVNGALVYGFPIPDELRDPHRHASQEAQS